MALSLKQIAFLDLYCGECQFNGTEAYSRVYRTTDRKAAAANAARLIANDRVAAELKSRMTERRDDYRQSAQAVAERLAYLGWNDPGDVPYSDQTRALVWLGKFLGMFQPLPISEVVLAHFRPEHREWVRSLMFPMQARAAVSGAGVTGADTVRQPGVPDDLGGLSPRPVTGSVDGRPVEPDFVPLFPPESAVSSDDSTQFA